MLLMRTPWWWWPAASINSNKASNPSGAKTEAAAPGHRGSPTMRAENVGQGVGQLQRGAFALSPSLCGVSSEHCHTAAAPKCYAWRTGVIDSLKPGRKEAPASHQPSGCLPQQWRSWQVRDTFKVHLRPCDLHTPQMQITNPNRPHRHTCPNLQRISPDHRAAASTSRSSTHLSYAANPVHLRPQHICPAPSSPWGQGVSRARLPQEALLRTR